MKMRQ